MKLIEMNMKEYLDILSSDEPAPGGGSASALVGAQGVALFLMIANLTLQKPDKYPDGVDACKKAIEKGEKLYKELTAQIDRDTEAFNLIANAFKMPKETEEEKAKRSEAIAEGTIAATEAPLNTMRYAFDAMNVAKTLVGVSNPNAVSDLGVSFLQLDSAVKGAWLNVKINLSGIKDEEKAKAYEKEGLKICSEAEKMAKENYDKVLGLM